MIKPVLIFLLILINCISSQNKSPIVFVHGFMGWGEEEMGPYKYWGGWFDLVEELENEGIDSERNRNCKESKKEESRRQLIELERIRNVKESNPQETKRQGAEPGGI